MKITPEDIEFQKEVGHTDKGKLYHIRLKGGYNAIVEKTVGGELIVLGGSSHRAYARHQAESMGKTLQFNETLWKSEKDDLYKTPIDPTNTQGQKTIYLSYEESAKKMREENRDALGNPIYESNPQNHYDLATHHSKMAGKAREKERQLKTEPQQTVDPNERHDAIMRNLMHSDIALKHFQASGLSSKQAHDEHSKHMDLYRELPEGKAAPFQDHALELAFNRANPGKKFPKGLGGNWSE